MEEKKSFEESLRELETVVKQLEEGKLALEDAIKAYERGIYLKKFCEERLIDAKMKIEKIELEAVHNS